MRRPLVALSIALAAVPVLAPRASAQSSQFGVRGLGYPGRPYAARTLATAGAFASFDASASVNPGSLAGLVSLEASLTGVMDYRSVSGPSGDASVRESRFPQFLVGGTLRQKPLTFGLSYSNYLARDFAIVAADTVSLRGLPVGVTDTLVSRGGIGDLRIAAAYHPGRWSLGAGLHVLTGSNRLRSSRVFADTTYVPVAQRAEVSYAGIGLSAGIVGALAPALELALSVRADGHLNVDRDSARTATVDLPFTFAAGARWRPRPRLRLAVAGMARTWSAANSDLLAQGGAGARNTIEGSFGAEYTPDVRRPLRKPLRLGVRYATLPFPLGLDASQPHEFGLALGTGTRFAADRAGVDLSVERLWRSADAHSERAWVLSVGVSVTP